MTEFKVPLEILVHQVHLVFLDLLDLLALRVLSVNWGSQVNKEHLDLQDLRVQLEL